MKRFAIQFGKDLGKSTLQTVKIASIGTIGLASSILSLTNSSIVAGCNTGSKKLKGKKTTFRKELIRINDYNDIMNKLLVGEVTMEQVYDSMIPDDFKDFLEFVYKPYKSAANSMDINSARG